MALKQSFKTSLMICLDPRGDGVAIQNSSIPSRHSLGVGVQPSANSRARAIPL